MILFRWLYSILPFITIISASSGDRSPSFQQCLSNCVTRTCTGDNGASGTSGLPLALRLTRWTCADDCKYQCMHILTDFALQEQSRAQQQGSPSHPSTRIHQYYGKWPFWRIAGMQEPASVAFSLFSLVFHVKGYSQIQNAIPNAHPMKWYYKMFAFVSMNAWVWSSVFHTRGALYEVCAAVALAHGHVQTFHLLKSWTISLPLLPSCLLSSTRSSDSSTSTLHAPRSPNPM